MRVIVEERQRPRCPPAAAPLGLRPPGPLALLHAPYMQPGMRVARAWPAGLGPCSKVGLLLRDRP